MAEMADIHNLLEAAWSAGATDLMLTVGACPAIRVDGDLRPLTDHVLDEVDTERLTLQVLPEKSAMGFHGGKEIDFSFDWQKLARIRGNAFHQRGMIALSLRLIPYAIPT